MHVEIPQTIYAFQLTHFWEGNFSQLSFIRYIDVLGRKYVNIFYRNGVKSILKSMQSLSFCHSFFLTPFLWTNFRAKYIYGFLLTWRRYSDRFKVNRWEFYLSYFENFPSEHNVMCPSKHELCVLPNIKLKLSNKGSPLQLAPKPTHTQRASIMGPKAPNMRVLSKGDFIIYCVFTRYL